MSPSDAVPSPVDFHDPAQARAWEEWTVAGKPWRPQFFAAFAAALNVANPARVPLAILEIGSGPGHLAGQILRDCLVRRYVALDFSAAMHGLARARLTTFLDRVEFVAIPIGVKAWASSTQLSRCKPRMRSATCAASRICWEKSREKSVQAACSSTVIPMLKKALAPRHPRLSPPLRRTPTSSCPGNASLLPYVRPAFLT